jgi:hypothetical protein
LYDRLAGGIGLTTLEYLGTIVVLIKDDLFFLFKKLVPKIKKLREGRGGPLVSEGKKGKM